MCARHTQQSMHVLRFLEDSNIHDYRASFVQNLMLCGTATSQHANSKYWSDEHTL
jgi:hypothetical protein